MPRLKKEPIEDSGPVVDVEDVPEDGFPTIDDEENGNDEIPRAAGCSGPSEEKAPARSITLSRMAAVYWIGGVVFLLIWAFGLGVVVGRGSIFESETIQALEERVIGRNAPETPPTVEVQGGRNYGAGVGNDPLPEENLSETDLTFYDSLNQVKPPMEPKPKLPPDPPAPKPKKMPEKQKTPPGTAKTKTIPAPAKSTEPTPQKTVKTGVGPAPEKRSSQEVTSGVKTVDPDRSKAPPPVRKSGENYTIQVAAARTTADAEKAVKKLRAAGFDAYYYQVELSGKQYFRIRVGRFSNIESAKKVKSRLEASGKKGLFISALTD